MHFAFPNSMAMTELRQSGFQIKTDYFFPGRDNVEVTPCVPVSNTDDDVQNDSEFRRVETATAANEFSRGGLDFSDVLDIVNPLQHLPVISSLYRSLTGDDISPVARIAGGALYGGPLGLISSVVNTAVEGVTGKDIGGNIIAVLFDESDGSSEVQSDEAALLSQNDHNNHNLAPLIPEIKADHSLPSQADVSGQFVPQLSPTAFDAILKSMNDAPRLTGRHGLAAGAETPPVGKGTIRDAGLEIHQILRAHSRQ